MTIIYFAETMDLYTNVGFYSKHTFNKYILFVLKVSFKFWIYCNCTRLNYKNQDGIYVFYTYL